jgi:hypothetical protein
LSRPLDAEERMETAAVVFYLNSITTSKLGQKRGGTAYSAVACGAGSRRQGPIIAGKLMYFTGHERKKKRHRRSLSTARALSNISILHPPIQVKIGYI